MHLKTHSGERSFNYASVLAGNVRKLLKIHSREKSYTCNRCDFPSVHSYDLQAMRLCIISGRQFEKTFKISLWRKILKSHSWAQLAQHLFTHSGEKTHHCGSSLRQAGDLKKHLLIHTGEKPFNCAKCWFSSAESSGLNIGDSVIWSDPLIKAELKLWTVIFVCWLLNMMACFVNNLLPAAN